MRAYTLMLAGAMLTSPGGVAAGPEPLAVEFVTASTAALAEPHDVALSTDGARLYVADNGNDRVVVLDAMTLGERGAFGMGELGAPHDVAIDRDGRLLVADTDNSTRR